MPYSQRKGAPGSTSKVRGWPESSQDGHKRREENWGDAAASGWGLVGLWGRPCAEGAYPASPAGQEALAVQLRPL